MFRIVQKIYNIQGVEHPGNYHNGSPHVEADNLPTREEARAKLAELRSGPDRYILENDMGGSRRLVIEESEV